MNNEQAKAQALVAVSKIVAAESRHKQKWDAFAKMLLSDEESEKLVMNMLSHRDQADEDDITLMLKTVAMIRYLNTCADLALKGLVIIDIDPTADVLDRLVFKRVDEVTKALESIDRPKYDTATAKA